MEIVFTDVSRMLFQPGASLPKVPSAESFKDSRLDVFQRLVDEVLIKRPIGKLIWWTTYTSSRRYL